MTTYGDILFEVEDGVAWLAMNRFIASSAPPPGGSTVSVRRQPSLGLCPLSPRPSSWLWPSAIGNRRGLHRHMTRSSRCASPLPKWPYVSA
jgi:hypothetical protein